MRLALRASRSQRSAQRELSLAPTFIGAASERRWTTEAFHRPAPSWSAAHTHARAPAIGDAGSAAAVRHASAAAAVRHPSAAIADATDVSDASAMHDMGGVNTPARIHTPGVDITRVAIPIPVRITRIVGRVRRVVIRIGVVAVAGVIVRAVVVISGARQGAHPIGGRIPPIIIAAVTAVAVAIAAAPVTAAVPAWTRAAPDGPSGAAD